ncbi:conserved hypothetical protein [Talaromyces stipitatus ATCC 10500]|uniref:Essential protein Yae1 N-terminal domain-containing protein n=1 Tax=Talaromyces stipitatus (strain ATCC 10500 / CBS 375.48 / QM 6759 / NRRL 1006) TaxID=441959 RepID=B8M731_TALSN|nr:uncharacterized protein TSTA_034850 [Talaromyces stipitatus ATCC 10500]EED20251.1 conserved hypothetical protein [Talaromyces stipitatus ATCC 10500]
MDTDILDNILSLEEQFYKEGYDLGVIDGARAGYTEGSVFAVEKSFENSSTTTEGMNEDIPSKDEDENAINTDICNSMPALHPGSRLAKNIQTLLGLVDPATLVLQNTEDAVSEIEERLKGALVKVKLIQRALGESTNVFVEEGGVGAGDGSGSIEDISSLRVRH